MTWGIRIALGWTVWLAFTSTSVGEDPQKPQKTKVELRWLEDKRIDGLTEDKGFRVSDTPDGVAYPHKQPALVLTAAEIDDVQLRKHDFSRSGNGIVYSVILHLKKEARQKLAATCTGNDTRYLKVAVGDKYWGSHRYEKDKDKPNIAPECRAETFTPFVGFFSSEAEAQRLVDAVK
jgi:hypothetical protein